MKIIVATLALTLAVAVASPALAQSRNKNRQYQVSPQGWDGYGQYGRRPHSSNPQWDVYRNDGTYAGSDPDPHVRMNLFRDNPHTDE
jgi:hypothetical protein